MSLKKTRKFVFEMQEVSTLLPTLKFVKIYISIMELIKFYKHSLKFKQYE